MTTLKHSPATRGNIPARTFNSRFSYRQVTVNASLKTSVLYTRPLPNGEETYVNVYKGEETKEKPTNADFHPQDVEIQDLRGSQGVFQLSQNGFQVERLEALDIDWTEHDEVRTTYYPLAEQMIKRASGASRVHVFEHILRQGRIRTAAVAPSDPAVMQPTNGLHVDFTPESGAQRLLKELPAEAEELSKTPFAIIQMWKPLTGPVDESPLALVDAQTVSEKDYLCAQLNFPDHTSSFRLVTHNPEHRFYYTQGMTTEEAVLFKCYDSRGGVAGFTPHCSFTDPNTPHDAPERRSIELRAFAFWQDEPAQEPAILG